MARDSQVVGSYNALDSKAVSSTRRSARIRLARARTHRSGVRPAVRLGSAVLVVLASLMVGATSVAASDGEESGAAVATVAPPVDPQPPAHDQAASEGAAAPPGLAVAAAAISTLTVDIPATAVAEATAGIAPGSSELVPGAPVTDAGVALQLEESALVVTNEGATGSGAVIADDEAVAAEQPLEEAPRDEAPLEGSAPTDALAGEAVPEPQVTVPADDAVDDAHRLEPATSSDSGAGRASSDRLVDQPLQSLTRVGSGADASLPTRAPAVHSRAPKNSDVPLPAALGTPSSVHSTLALRNEAVAPESVTVAVPAPIRAAAPSDREGGPTRPVRLPGTHIDLIASAEIASTSMVAFAAPRIPVAVSVAMEFGKAGSGWAGAIVFNVWLRRELRVRRMSQRQLAHLSGVNHSTISRLVTADRTPSLETAAKLAKALRMSTEDTAAYFGLVPEQPIFATQRVEAALRGDPDLQDTDVRAVMNAYLLRRARRRGDVATLPPTGSGRSAS